MANRRDEVLAYLAGHHVMTLATHGHLGPWAAAVFYVNDGFSFTFLSAPHSRHSSDLAANPRAAAAIHENHPDWPDIKGIQLEGHVQKLSGPDRIKAMARYARKFPVVRPDAAPALIQAALGRMAWYQLAAQRCLFIDNSMGFGHRDEVPLTDS